MRNSSLAAKVLVCLPTLVCSFTCPSAGRPRAIVAHRTSSTSIGESTSEDGSGPVIEVITDDVVPPASSPIDNPFLPLLSEGLHRTSIAMDKSTSDQVFKSSAGLNQLRKQVQQLTSVGPSSLGEHAGLGLFATKNIKAGTVVGLYPAHALGYELVVPIDPEKEMTEDNLQDLSMFIAGSEGDSAYFSQQPHGNSPFLHATDQPLFQRPSLLSPLFDEGKEDEMSPPLYLDVNPQRNNELDPIWTSHYINDGASLVDMVKGGASVEEGIEQYYTQSTQTKNCIHIPFGPSPILATVATKKIKKGQELFTSYGCVYWLGAVGMPEDEDEEATPDMTEKIQSQIVESARDLQRAMAEAEVGYATEMADLEKIWLT